MKEKKYGRVINILSTSVKSPIANLGVSNTIRAAVANWAKTLSLEVSQFGITVNSVAPGFMPTSPDYIKQWNSYGAEKQNAIVEGIAMRRIGKPDDIANAVIFFSSNLANWVTGQTLAVTGGP